MADAVVIREFLVGLGYRVDEGSQRRMNDAVLGMTKNIGKMALAIESAAGLMLTGIGVIANKMNDLFYASRRAGSSAEDISAFSFAVSQLGGSSAGARQAIEKFADFIRSNPLGAAQILRAIGVSDAAIQSGNAVRIMEEVAPRFQAMVKQYGVQGYQIVRHWAEQIGIDRDTLNAMLQKDFPQLEQQYRRIIDAFGVDQDKASQNAVKYNRAMNEIYAAVDAIKQRFFQDIGGDLATDLEQLEGYLEKNKDTILKVMEDLTTGLVAAARDIVNGIGFIIDKIHDFIDWANKLGPTQKMIVEVLGGIGAAWALLNAGMLLSPVGVVLALAGAFATLAGDFEKWEKTGKSDWGIDWQPLVDTFKTTQEEIRGIGRAIEYVEDKIADWWQAFVDFYNHLENLPIVKNIQSMVDHVLSLLGKLPSWIIPGAHAATTPGGATAGGGVSGFYPPGYDPNAKPGSGGRVVGGIGSFFSGMFGGGSQGHVTAHPERLQAAVNFFRSAGWTLAQAAGIAANIQAESSFDEHAVGDNGQAYGLGQWHPDRQAKFKSIFGKDIQNSTFAEQLQFYDWELRNSERAAGQQIGAATTPEGAAAGAVASERPANMMAASLQRGRTARGIYEQFSTTPLAANANQPSGANVQIGQQNTFNINGGNADQISQGIGRELDRRNQDLVRNTRVAVR